MDYRKTGTDEEIYNRYKEQISKEKYSIYLIERNEYLIKKGLFKYIESNEEDKDSILDEEDGKYWKKVPINISHDEYIYIKKLHGELTAHKTKVSGIFVLGLGIIFVGLMAAMVISTMPLIGTTIAVIFGVSSFLFGCLYLALGTIIEEIKIIYESINGLN